MWGWDLSQDEAKSKDFNSIFAPLGFDVDLVKFNANELVVSNKSSRT